MITGQELQALLDNGYIIYSSALGRVGKVLGTLNNLVRIKLNRGTGMTSFTSGDPVELVKDEKTKKAYIRHPESAWENWDKDLKKAV